MPVLSKKAGDYLRTSCLTALRASESCDGVASQAQLSCSANSLREGCQKEACPFCQGATSNNIQTLHGIGKQDCCLVYIPGDAKDTGRQAKQVPVRTR